jgi:uncharacterized integral membrane protein
MNINEFHDKITQEECIQNMTYYCIIIIIIIIIITIIIIIINYLTVYLSMALQSFVGPGPIFQFLHLIHSR